MLHSFNTALPKIFENTGLYGPYILPYMDRIYDPVPIRGNEGQ